MSASRQLSLGPMGVKEVSRLLESPSKPVGSTPLVDIAVRAFIVAGHTSQESARLIDTSQANFSKAFSKNWPENNPFMKKWDDLPFQIRREFARLLMVDYELTAPDAEQTRIVKDFARLLRVVGE
jgi:hypothetical protein